ncbi:MAG: nucleotidyl transferase AbiEii/AbiGii toxin family protein [Patescibacteria group bacterium]
MINYSQIVKTASEKGVSVETIEKDYFIELFLFYFSKHKNIKDLIFRGGTALKKMYFPDYRFSEDLDFLTKERLDKFSIDKIIEKINHDFPFEVSLNKKIMKDSRLQIFINYNISSKITAVKNLKIDILKDNYIPSFKTRDIKFSYEDFKNLKAKIQVYNLESVVADKISRIFDVVNEPRDIYDIYYLFNLKLDLKKIRKIFIEKHGFDFNINDFLMAIKKQEYKLNWKIRLSKQIPELLDFEKAIKKIEDYIKNNGF